MKRIEILLIASVLTVPTPGAANTRNTKKPSDSRALLTVFLHGVKDSAGDPKPISASYEDHGFVIITRDDLEVRRSTSQEDVKKWNKNGFVQMSMPVVNAKGVMEMSIKFDSQKCKLQRFRSDNIRLQCQTFPSNKSAFFSKVSDVTLGSSSEGVTILNLLGVDKSLEK